jgi:hypothetical protein
MRLGLPLWCQLPGEHQPGPLAPALSPQPAAGCRCGGGGAEEPAPVPVGVTGHRTQRPRGQVGPPGAHPAHPSSPLDPGGERWPKFRVAGLADHPAALRSVLLLLVVSC